MISRGLRPAESYGLRTNTRSFAQKVHRMNSNISPGSVQHSLLTPDDGLVIEVQEIDVVSLKDYVDRHVTFAKLEPGS
jgi:hypothetical protein